MDEISILIEKILAEYEGKLIEMQSSLSDSVISYLEGSIDVKGGKIISGKANSAKILFLEKVYVTFLKTKQIPLFKWIFEKLDDIFKLNIGWYKQFSDDEKRFTSIVSDVLKAQFERLGYDGKGFAKGGLFELLATSTQPLQDLKIQTILAISRNESFADFKKSLAAKIKGNGSNGLLQKHFNTTIYDTFTNFDREVNNEFAERQGLNFALYLGGKIKTSRAFCIARNGRAFTRAEISAWQSLEFDGKTNPYNPFVNLGGHGCRHTLRWISESEYIRRKAATK